MAVHHLQDRDVASGLSRDVAFQLLHAASSRPELCEVIYVAHNIKTGVLMQTPGGEIKYSWRGMIYLWCQFLLDLVRL